METQDVAVTDQSVQDAIALLSGLPTGNSQEACIERIQGREQAKRILAAGQAHDTHIVVEERRAEEAAMRIPTSEQLKGADAEIGLARGETAYMGASFTRTAIALHTVLPNTRAALASGRVSEFHARVVAEQTMHLSDVHRREIDAAIAHRLGKASTWQLRQLIEGHAYRLDRKAAEARANDNKARRRVCMYPASDGQVYITAELPTLQGLAVMDTLRKLTNKRRANHKANAADDKPAGRDQIMADLFVELITGQTTADAVTGEVLVVIQDTALLGDDDLPAWIPGHGPLVADIVKRWLADPDAATFIRRLYTRPTDGQLVAMESTRRYFPETLGKMLRIRDDICATPWCNNPAEDADHRQPWAQGGATSWNNGNALCKGCNQRKENRGWSYTGSPDELTVTTPTGHSHTVPTRPPLAELKHWNSDPPPRLVIEGSNYRIAA